MRGRSALATLFVLAGVAVNAQADDPERKVEIGAGLAAIAVYDAGSTHVTMVGVPSDSFGPFSPVPPTIYASFFPTPKLGLETQAGFLSMSSRGSSFHVLTAGEQVDLFFKDRRQGSPYVLGRVFLLDRGSSDEGTDEVLGPPATHFAAGVGLGYRLPLGRRATFRVEGRFDHVFPKTLQYGEEPATDMFGAYVGIGIML